MATYTELAAIAEDPSFGALRSRILAAVAIKAAGIIDSATPSSAALAWAQRTMRSPSSGLEDVLWYVVAKNAGATVAQIVGADDAAVQANVSSAVDALYP